MSHFILASHEAHIKKFVRGVVPPLENIFIFSLLLDQELRSSVQRSITDQ